MNRLPFTATALLALAALGSAQETLTCSEALALGKARNGTIRAAAQDTRAYQARLRQSRAKFLPTIDVNYTYSDQRIDNFQVSADDPFRTSISKGGAATLSTQMTLLDTGERRLGVRYAEFALRAQEATALQVLRTTLVDVYSLYVSALRAQELERVAEANVTRAENVVKQAEAQAKVGDIAEKDIYQPRADALNAKVNLLAAQADTATSKANLKAAIGWDPTKPLPTLAPLDVEDTPEQIPLVADEAVKIGLKGRADLIAQRGGVDQQDMALRLSRLASGPTLNADYSYTRQHGGLADTGQGAFALLLSYPLFDGGVRRDDVRIAQASLDAYRLELEQSERSARAEIESLVQENILGKQRVEAALLAVDAARINYDKVVEATRLGVEGTDLVSVATAQVSLITAETNAVQAKFDYELARVRLRLAVGMSVPGEDR